MKDIIFINSHPIQYFAPLYKFMNGQGVKTKAWYCSGETSKGSYDKEFGIDVKWDIPLLNGYEYTFFKNNSPQPSHAKGFFGLMNFAAIKALFTIKKSVIVVHGWNYFTHLSVLLLGKIKGHTICLRCEMPQNQETLKKGWKQLIKRLALKHIVFPRVNYFLYIGTQNKLFYKSYNIPETQLIFCPYSVDGDRFRADKQKLQQFVGAIKKNMGIPTDGKVILYSGKYSVKKRPMDILRAFKQLNEPYCWLIMVGEGEMRDEMEAFIDQHQLKQVILTGFINQSVIPQYYAISDVFVMCSSVGETWGLSVNEAMNFDLPIIISHLTGCAQDLVEDGNNGYIFKTGDVDDLAQKLKMVLIERKLLWSKPSQTIVNKYSYSSIKNNIEMLSVDEGAGLKKEVITLEL